MGGWVAPGASVCSATGTRIGVQRSPAGDANSTEHLPMLGACALRRSWRAHNPRPRQSTMPRLQNTRGRCRPLRARWVARVGGVCVSLYGVAGDR